MTMAPGEAASRSLEEKRARLEAALRRKLDQASLAPLAFNQHRMWFLDQLDPGSPLFNISLAFWLRGPLEQEILQRVFGDLVQRHETLRTTFETGPEGQPLQRIHPSVPLVPQFVEFADLPGETGGEKIGRFVREESRTRFDLGRGPLGRACLARVSPREHLVVLTCHHILSDGWSVGVFLQDLKALYEWHSGRSPAPALARLSIQYRDYARWQRGYLQGEALQRLRDFWQAALAGAPQSLDLPFDRALSSQSADPGDVVRFSIEPDLNRSLARLAGEHGATLFVVLLTAYACYLHRCSAQTDFLVGVPVAGRERVETHPLIGYFVNLLPVRIRIEAADTFLSLMQRVRTTVAEAIEHQEMPFEKLVELLAVDRQGGRHPLVQTVFNFFSFPLVVPAREGELQIERVPVHPGISRFDIGLNAEPDGDGLACLLEYNSGLFDPSTVRRMADGWCALLQSVVRNPAQSLSRLSVLSQADRQLLVHDWNDTDRPFPGQVGVHGLVRRQVLKTPLAPAILHEGGEVSYAELWRDATRIADWVGSLDLPDEAPVAVWMDRCPAMIAGLLGILLSGHPWLPLDSTWPAERSRMILARGQVAAAIVDNRCGQLLAGEPAPGRPAWLLNVQDPAGIPAKEPRTGAEYECEPFDAARLAYIIFTSGSTGEPKGVMVEHGSVVNVIHSFCRTYQLGPQDRMLQQSPVSFDVSVNEIFPVLATGGAVVIPPPDIAGDFERLVEVIESRQVTLLGATPSMLTGLNRWHSRLKSLRLVLSGGEALAASQIDRLLSQAVVTNGYGPTETTVCATCFQLRPGEVLPPGSVPIGRPLANYRVYVLDPAGELVPIGCPGELCIAGKGVARGYFQDPQLTAAKFAANPFSPGTRMYRTGDEVRWLPSGDLQFLGRLDRQVKIRGVRLEPGEVEAALASHPEVLQAAVAFGKSPDSPEIRMTGFVVLRRAGSFAGSWRDYLLEKLPPAMIPATVIELEEMPLTANGKIDRARLPPPSHSARKSRDYVAPRTEDEIRMAAIWSGALGVDQVGLHDDFFELGGHSLLVSGIIHRIRSEFQVPLSYRAFFEARTVAGAVSGIEQLKRAGAAIEAPAPGDPLPPAVLRDADVPGLGGPAEDRPDPWSQWLPWLQESGERPVDFGREVELDEGIAAGDRPAFVPEYPPRTVFVTGGTGFLGAFLLQQLALQTPAEIHCLVRATSPGAGLEKLRLNLSRWKLDVDAVLPRLVPVSGDLAQPGLGIQPAEWDRLADRVDVIFHNGAWVNFLYPYSVLRASNVGGTREILRLAASRRIKPVHLTSTLSVLFGRNSRTGTIRETDTFDDPASMLNGYAQSKWVAERIAALAQQRGIPLSLYRPGRVTGDSRSGLWSDDDLLVTILAAMVRFGSAPDLDLDLDWTPVDYVAKAMVTLAGHREALGGTFHLVNPRLVAWRDLIAHLAGRGYPLELQPWDDWRARLPAALGTALESHFASQGSGPFPARSGNGPAGAAPAVRSQTVYDCTQTERLLVPAGVVCPHPDAALLTRCFDSLIEQGRLPRPAKPA